jgi:deazaflavin-dependent oxidoreductase (nitroreductase family)
MARRGLVYRLFARLSGTRAMGLVSRLVAWRIDPLLLRLTGSRVGFSLLLPSALLETTGAKSGARRANGVIYFHDGGDPIVIASKLGLPHHPAWFHNVRKNPQVRLGGQPFHAEVVADAAEQERLWALARRVFPPFADYRARAAAAGRTIPIIRLKAQGRGLEAELAPTGAREASP